MLPSAKGNPFRTVRMSHFRFRIFGLSILFGFRLNFDQCSVSSMPPSRFGSPRLPTSLSLQSFRLCSSSSPPFGPPPSIPNSTLHPTPPPPTTTVTPPPPPPTLVCSGFLTLTPLLLPAYSPYSYSSGFYGKPSYAFVSPYTGYGGLSGYEGPAYGLNSYWQPAVAYPPYQSGGAGLYPSSYGFGGALGSFSRFISSPFPIFPGSGAFAAIDPRSVPCWPVLANVPLAVPPALCVPNPADSAVPAPPTTPPASGVCPPPPTIPLRFSLPPPPSAPLFRPTMANPLWVLPPQLAGRAVTRTFTDAHSGQPRGFVSRCPTTCSTTAGPVAVSVPPPALDPSLVPDLALNFRRRHLARVFRQPLARASRRRILLAALGHPSVMPGVSQVN